MQPFTLFKQSWLAWLLILPQLIITIVFFIWPSMIALKYAFFRGDVFGLHHYFNGFGHFIDLIKNESYRYSVAVTFFFSLTVAVLALVSGLFMAVLVNGVSRGAAWYKTLLIWPYAVAPAVAAILWRFLFNPSVGVLSYFFHELGFDWNYTLIGKQAFMVVVIASVWQQFSYNFLFFLAGLQAVPYSLLEAAALDGAGPFQRFWHIVFPLLSPTSFFLLIINLMYAFFDTFGIIQIITQGGPAEATNTLVYRVYMDGFIGMDLGASAAQSVVLMLILILLTVFQFRFIEKKVHY